EKEALHDLSLVVVVLPEVAVLAEDAVAVADRRAGGARRAHLPVLRDHRVPGGRRLELSVGRRIVSGGPAERVDLDGVRDEEPILVVVRAEVPEADRDRGDEAPFLLPQREELPVEPPLRIVAVEREADGEALDPVRLEREVGIPLLREAEIARGAARGDVG